MPPLSLHTSIQSPSNQLATNKEEAKDQSDDVIEVKYEDVGDILESCLCEAETSGGLDEKKASDIRKRIGILKEKWTTEICSHAFHSDLHVYFEQIQAKEMNSNSKNGVSGKVRTPKIFEWNCQTNQIQKRIK